MKIAKIELYDVSIPLPKAFCPAWIPGYQRKYNRSTLIKITANNGLIGYSTGSYLGEAHGGPSALMGQYMIGKEVERMEELRHLLREGSFLGWQNNFMEPAFWDLLGKKEGKPVYELLGGKGGRLKVYCSTGELHEPEVRAEEMQSIKEMGFKSVKLRVHDHDINRDIEQIKVVRKAVGDGIEIGVDANQGWPVTIADSSPIWDLKRAVEFAKACEEYNIAWLEEPLDMYAFDEMAELRRRTKTPIAGGELTTGWHEHKMLFEKDSLDIYQPDSLYTGIGTAVKIMKEAARRNLGFSPHTWFDGVGFAINLQVAAASYDRRALEYPFDPPAWVPKFRDYLLKEPFMIDSEGYVTVPNKPGLGFEIDEQVLRKYGCKYYEMDKSRV